LVLVAVAVALTAKVHQVQAELELLHLLLGLQ
jgi:hypothetical protein